MGLTVVDLLAIDAILAPISLLSAAVRAPTTTIATGSPASSSPPSSPPRSPPHATLPNSLTIGTPVTVEVQKDGLSIIYAEDKVCLTLRKVSNNSCRGSCYPTQASPSLRYVPVVTQSFPCLRSILYQKLDYPFFLCFRAASSIFFYLFFLAISTRSVRVLLNTILSPDAHAAAPCHTPFRRALLCCCLCSCCQWSLGPSLTICSLRANHTREFKASQNRSPLATGAITTATAPRSMSDRTLYLCVL